MRGALQWFPFLQCLEARKAHWCNLGTYCRSNGRCIAVPSKDPAVLKTPRPCKLQRNSLPALRRNVFTTRTTFTAPTNLTTPLPYFQAESVCKTKANGTRSKLTTSSKFTMRSIFSTARSFELFRHFVRVGGSETLLKKTLSLGVLSATSILSKDSCVLDAKSWLKSANLG